MTAGNMLLQQMRDSIRNLSHYVTGNQKEPLRQGMDEKAATYDIPIPLQYIGCQDLLNEDTCSHCGWLRKKRTVSLFHWPQTYVVLHEGCFYYFKNERSKSPSGKFSLYGYNSVFRAGEIAPKEATWVFKIVHSHSEFRTYYFSTSSEQEMKEFGQFYINTYKDIRRLEQNSDERSRDPWFTEFEYFLFMYCFKYSVGNLLGNLNRKFVNKKLLLKTWMLKVKREMLKANGKLLAKWKKSPKEEQVEEEAGFYQQIETNIYDDAEKFRVTTEYSKQCSIKRENEDSDDEDPSVDSRTLENRPRLPLPGEAPDAIDDQSRAPLPLPRPTENRKTLPPKPPFKPPRVPGDTGPPTPPRTRPHRNSPEKRDRSPVPIVSQDANPSIRQKIQLINENLVQINSKRNEERKKENTKPRRSSYEKTELQGQKSPIFPSGKAPLSLPMLSPSHAGGSTGEEDDERDEDYWAAIYFDEANKQKANEIIQAIGEEGVYLVRPGESGQEKVLVVYANDTAKKYRIQVSEDGQYFLAKEGFRNNQLEELLRFYYDEELPTVQVKLTWPYKLHDKFKKLNI